MADLKEALREEIHALNEELEALTEKRAALAEWLDNLNQDDSAQETPNDTDNGL